MSAPFVWFHHNGSKAAENTAFFDRLLDWRAAEGPGGCRMLAGDAGPFAALGSPQERFGDRDEWIPFVEVSDVEATTERALALGAALVQPKTRGPAGEFAVVRDPGGAALALWKKAG